MAPINVRKIALIAVLFSTSAAYAGAADYGITKKAAPAQSSAPDKTPSSARTNGAADYGI